MHQLDIGQLLSQSLLQLQQASRIAGHQHIGTAGTHGVELTLQDAVGHIRLGDIIGAGAAATGVGRIKLVENEAGHQF